MVRLLAGLVGGLGWQEAGRCCVTPAVTGHACLRARARRPSILPEFLDGRKSQAWKPYVVLACVVQPSLVTLEHAQLLGGGVAAVPARDAVARGPSTAAVLAAGVAGNLSSGASTASSASAASGQLLSGFSAPISARDIVRALLSGIGAGPAIHQQLCLLALGHCSVDHYSVLAEELPALMDDYTGVSATVPLGAVETQPVFVFILTTQPRL